MAADFRQIETETWDDIVRYGEEGWRLIDLSREAKPDEVVKAITEHVRDVKARSASLSEDEILALGILLGWQYVRGHGWHWNEVVWDGDEESVAIGVLSEDNAIFINPMWWMDQSVNTDRSTTFMLNYNMVAAGNVPAAGPNEALGFH